MSNATWLIPLLALQAFGVIGAALLPVVSITMVAWIIVLSRGSGHP